MTPLNSKCISYFNDIVIIWTSRRGSENQHYLLIVYNYYSLFLWDQWDWPAVEIGIFFLNQSK